MSSPRKNLEQWLWNYLAAAIVAVCVVTLTSCEPELSLHRLYTDADLVFDPNLLGTWVLAEPSKDPDFVELDFASAKINEYTITFVDKDEGHLAKIVFAAHLVKLHGRVFIDVTQTGSYSDGRLQEGSIAIPGHMIGRIALDGDALSFSFLDDEWITSHIRSRDITVETEHEDIGPDVLTASTADLQSFVVEHADDDEAFSFTLEGLQRKKSNSP